MQWSCEMLPAGQQTLSLLFRNTPGLFHHTQVLAAVAPAEQGPTHLLPAAAAPPAAAASSMLLSWMLRPWYCTFSVFSMMGFAASRGTAGAAAGPCSAAH